MCVRCSSIIIIIFFYLLCFFALFCVPSPAAGVGKSKKQEEREWRELYDAIGYSEDDFDEFPKEYVAHKVLVHLALLKLKLSGRKQKE